MRPTRFTAPFIATGCLKVEPPVATMVLRTAISMKGSWG
jgi:hypothetical protein